MKFPAPSSPFSCHALALALFLGLAATHAQQAPAAPATDLPATASTSTSATSTSTAAPTSTNTAVAADAAKPASTLPTIFVCGDSTARNDGKDRQGRQMRGWGTPLADYFDSSKVVIDNVAHAGTSSRTYYDGDWPKVLPKIKAGDYVLEVFGINDGGLRTPNGLGDEVDAQGWHTYGWYMSKMATDAQAKGAHVILLTLTVRNVWTNPLVKFTDAKPNGPLPEGYDPKQDKIARGDKYAGWTKDVGEKLHISVLDLNNLEGDKHEKMGREAVDALYSDHNHTFPAGAELLASYIVSGLKALKNSPFVPLLSEKGKAVETADVKYVIDNLPTDKPADAKPADPKPAETTPAKTTASL
jgi:lysophospholipase L1-like esterase